MTTIAQRERTSTFIAPEHLHDIIAPAQTREVTFASEKAMRSYRSMLYSINRQGDYRYRTIRSEGGMWALVLWRMK